MSIIERCFVSYSIVVQIGLCAVWTVFACGLAILGSDRWWDNKRGGLSLMAIGVLVLMIPFMIVALSA